MNTSLRHRLPDSERGVRHVPRHLPLKTNVIVVELIQFAVNQLQPRVRAPGHLVLTGLWTDYIHGDPILGRRRLWGGHFQR
jgi:hypothetical protein